MKVYDIREWKVLKTVASQGDKINCIGVEGSLVVTGNQDGWVQLWGSQNNTCLSSIQKHQGGVRTLGFYQDTLVTGGDDGLCRLYDVKVWNFL